MKRNLRLTAALFTLLMVFGAWSWSASASDFNLEGTWSGVLDLPGAELELFFHIITDAGAWQGFLDVPAQGGQGIPLTEISIDGREIVLDVSLIAGTFVGELKQNGAVIEGTWAQSGLKLPLVLEQAAEFEKLQPNRPQEPQPPYPYGEIEVSYPNKEAGIELAGTLTVPEGDGPFPTALLITGSGPQDRNEEIMGHKPFLVLADYLTRRGVAVLRVDDRGVGQSSGDFAAATTLDFASDVLAGLEYLKTRGEVDAERIGLIGHSEGGLIAGMVAAENRELAFIVLMAGPGLTGEEVSLLQTALILESMGVSEDNIRREQELQKKLFAIATLEENLERAEAKVRKTLDAFLANLSEQELQAMGDVEVWKQAQIDQLLSPWFRFFLTYDPILDLMQITCPVLAINGSKDLQVPARENLAAIEQALKLGGNENFTILELPGLNHLFQTAETGSPDEYYYIEETIAPQALEAIGDWLAEVVGLE